MGSRYIYILMKIRLFQSLILPTGYRFVMGKVMLSQASVCPHGGGGAVGVPSGNVWSRGGGGGSQMATSAVGSHPTGMHPCLKIFRRNEHCEVKSDYSQQIRL